MTAKECLNEDYTEIILAERAHYNNVYNAIEKIIENKFTIYGHLAYNLLLNNKLNTQCFVYNILIKDGFRDAKYIADKLYEKTNGMIRLETVIPNISFSLKYNGRLMIQMMNIKSPGSIISRGITMNSYHNNTIHIASFSLLLGALYKDLYTFSKAGEWEDILEKEYSLFQLYKSKQKCPEIDFPENRNKEEIIGKVFDLIVKNNSKVMLVGEYAVSYISDISRTYRLSILSTMTDDEIKEKLKPLGDVTYKFTKLSAIDDNRLGRTVFSVGKHQFMYKYNILDYDVTNYGELKNDIGETICIGNIFCTLRICCINLQVIDWQHERGDYEEDYYRLVYDTATNILFRIHDSMYDDNKLKGIYSMPTSSLYCFNTKNIIGVFIDETRQNKMDNAGISHPAYLPAKSSQ